VAFEPSDAIELPLNGEVVVTMSVVVPTNAEALTGEIGVVAQAEPGQRDGAVTVAVDNRLLIDIDNGIGATLHPFPPTVEIRLGAIVEFRNLDNDIHRIHADDDGAGFPHQENVMVQGESYAVSITRTGGYNYYCHIHEVGLGVGRIEVIDPTP
jgi:plastocyanin